MCDKLQEFLEAEVENREASGGTMSDYVDEAKSALEQFACLRAELTTAQARIEALEAGMDQIFSRISYVNIHGVGEQPEPNGLPQLVHVKPDEFWALFQGIGKIAADALEDARRATQGETP